MRSLLITTEGESVQYHVTVCVFTNCGSAIVFLSLSAHYISSHLTVLSYLVVLHNHNLTLNNIKWKSEGVHKGFMEGGHKADFADVLDGLHY